VSKSRLVVHALLIVYAALLAYVILGLVFNYYVSADVFFDLSFALLFFAIAQAVYELGVRKAALFFILTTMIGYAAEVLGTNVGIPFGKYSYSDVLGERVLGVPIVVPVVWFVIAYICLSMMRTRKKAGRGDRQIILTTIITAFGVVAWDFLIDPMFSSQSYGYWTWSSHQLIPTTLSGVPLTNFLGWFVVAMIMVSLFLYITKGSNPMMKRGNTTDSVIIYVLLMIDGTVANIALGHALVVIIGVTAMLAFIVVSRVLSMKEEAKEESSQLKGVPVQTGKQ